MARSSHRKKIPTAVLIPGLRHEAPGATIPLVDGERRVRRETTVPREAWKACLHDHHPAYISWDQFMANQEKLNANRANHSSPDQRGAAREGIALLQGIVLCGRCGHRMTVHYTVRRGWSSYVCSAAMERGQPMCWSVALTSP